MRRHFTRRVEDNAPYHGWTSGGRGATALPGEIDIVFRQAAKAGEALVSEFCADGEKTLHTIRRTSDSAILATAAIVPSKEAVA